MLIVYKQGCPYSRMALKEIKKRKIKFIKMTITENKELKNRNEMYNKIKKMTGHKTFPVIYKNNGKKIGGYSELMKYLSKVQ
tara:strand:+ start:731 stop:976 length:246 start_codon:yes stop_codon:yes gene_type:complete